MNEPSILRGTVHGKTIELDCDAGLADGQPVAVTVRPIASVGPEDGSQQSFGTWADDADELDEFLQWNRAQRKRSRAGIKP